MVPLISHLLHFPYHLIILNPWLFLHCPNHPSLFFSFYLVSLNNYALKGLTCYYPMVLKSLYMFQYFDLQYYFQKVFFNHSWSRLNQPVDSVDYHWKLSKPFLRIVTTSYSISFKQLVPFSTSLIGVTFSLGATFFFGDGTIIRDDMMNFFLTLSKKIIDSRHRPST